MSESWSCKICASTERYERRDGTPGGCKGCARNRATAYRLVNGELAKAAKKACYEAQSVRIGRKTHTGPITCEYCGAPPEKWFCSGLCRSCYQKRDYYKNPEKYKVAAAKAAAKPQAIARAKQWREDKRVYQMVRGAKKRALKAGIPFDLTEDDVFVPETCPVFGVRMVHNTGSKSGPGEWSPSLDRIIPELGYVRGNVQVISFKANVMKQDASPEQLKMFAEWVLNRA